MGLKRLIAGQWAAKRGREIRRISRMAAESQERTLRHLLQTARNTAFGRQYGFGSLASVRDFQARVPVRDYEANKAFFDSIARGEDSVTWPGKPLYLAKTSGTVSGAKFIPITRQSIRFQIKGARDALLLYLLETGNSGFLDGKMLFLSGSPALETNAHGMKVGRLSGIVNHWVPAYLRTNQVPTFDTNCIEDWETKVERILDECIGQDLRLISGIPPWVQMFFERLHARTGKLPQEQWPNLSLFVQGGVDFSPYRPVFRNFLDNRVNLVEVFPASEGFFAFQDSQREPGLLLNLEYGIFYEFVPLGEYGNPDAKRLTLSEVETGKQYALVVSTNAGLWAYDIGDTVRFVSINPYKVVVTGRVKHFISAFGEHVIAEEVNAAMVAACKTSGAEVTEFTVAPFVSVNAGESYHEWFVEFSRLPQDMAAFAETLDAEIRKQNVYYDDLRRGEMLRPVQVRQLKQHATRDVMKLAGKLGGQNKFPRLSNNRDWADKLNSFITHLS